MRSGEVEGGVDQRVCLGVLLARHVRELDVLVLGEQLPRPLVVRPKVRLLHPVPAFELTDDQLRIGPDAYAPGGELPGGLERGDQGAVLGHVVRRHPDAFAHGREPGGRIGGRVEHDGADRSRARVAARAAVAVDDELGSWRHGTRMQPQLSQWATVPGGLFRMRSASTDGMDRWHPWHVLPLRRAAPTPRARSPPSSSSISPSTSPNAAPSRSASDSSSPTRAPRVSTSASMASRRSITSSSRSSRPRRWRRSWATSAWSACSSRGEVTSPEYIRRSTSAALSSSDR